MKKILVTGANGFVGKTVCATLRARSMAFVPAVRQAVNSDEIAIGDISTATRWHDVLSGCDSVIHLAARVHVMRDESSDPLTIYRSINCDATLNLARQSVESGVKRFIYVSSIKVNGESTADRPFTAFDEPRPVDPYAQSKFEAEVALQELSRQTGLELVIVRPPLVYGPGVRANFLSLMRLVKMGIPLPFGAIHNRRSMVAVDNLADLLVCCTLHPAAVGHTFLVSDDHDIGTPDLVRRLAASMGRRARLLPFPERLLATGAGFLGKAAMVDRLFGSLQVDIEDTKTILGWHPQVRMDNAIDATVVHFLSQS